jgi:DHA2 family multidrug resistance protein
MAAMMVVGRLVGRIDTRLLLTIGLGCTAWAFYTMTRWTPDVSQMTIVVVGAIQGIGLGFLFVPLSVVTLSTLSPEQRTEGTGVYTFARNVGSSIGISIVGSLLTQGTQINHADIGRYVTATNRAYENPIVMQFWNPATAAGRAAVDAVVTHQAQIIAYMDDYKFLMIATLAVFPLLMVFRKPSAGSVPVHVVMGE